MSVDKEIIQSNSLRHNQHYTRLTDFIYKVVLFCFAVISFGTPYLYDAANQTAKLALFISIILFLLVIFLGFYLIYQYNVNISIVESYFFRLFTFDFQENQFNNKLEKKQDRLLILSQKLSSQSMSKEQLVVIAKETDILNAEVQGMEDESKKLIEKFDLIKEPVTNDKILHYFEIVFYTLCSLAICSMFFTFCLKIFKN